MTKCCYVTKSAGWPNGTWLGLLDSQMAFVVCLTLGAGSARFFWLAVTNERETFEYCKCGAATFCCDWTWMEQGF